MRNLLLLTALLFLSAAQGQQNEQEAAFNFEPRVRLYGIAPVNFGDNYLADANKSRISAGFNLSFFEYHKFRLMAGADHIFYRVTDVSMAADVKRSRHTSFYAAISYEIPVTKELSVQPFVGGGFSELNFKRETANGFNGSISIDDNSITKQNGTEFRAGLFVDYKLSPVVSVFTGATYVSHFFDVQTARAFEDYFGKAQLIQLHLGLKIGYSRKDKLAAAQAK